MSLDNDIFDITASQLGLITIAQLVRYGASRAQVRSRVANGLLVPGVRGVFRIAGSPPSWRQSLLAGLLSLGEGALVSHRAAAVLLGFEGFPEGPLEFTVPPTRRLLLDGAHVHSSKRLDLIDRTVVDELFACTTASRTIVDLAATTISATELGNAIDSAIRDGSTSPTFLRKRIAALRGAGAHGVSRLDELLVDSGGHSFLERRFLRLMREHSLPRPRTQVIHRRDGRTFARVDFEFWPLPLVVEVSGRRGHVTEADRRRDAHRRNRLQADGLTVLEFVTVDVIDRGAHVAQEVDSHLARLRAQTL